MTNKYMYFIANWKMFGVLNSLNTLNRVVKFFKNFKKRESLKIGSLKNKELYFPFLNIRGLFNRKKTRIIL